MAGRGKKYGDEIKEKAIAMYGICGSYSQVARAVSYTHLDVYKRQVQSRSV